MWRSPAAPSQACTSEARFHDSYGRSRQRREKETQLAAPRRDRRSVGDLFRGRLDVVRFPVAKCAGHRG